MRAVKEEVINGLIACSEDISGCTKCPFRDCGCFPELRDVIIELLESQGEPPAIDPERLPIVKELRAEIERLQTVSENWEKQWNGEYQMRKTMEEKLARYEKAEQEGRLAEFPCNAGDTVWINGRLGLFEATVTRIYQDCSGVWRIHADPCGIAPIWLVCEMKLYNFGKTVFLTREEAEAALKERETDGLSKSVDH